MQISFYQQRYWWKHGNIKDIQLNENCSLILRSGILSADLKDTEVLILEFCDFSCCLHAVLRQYKHGIIFSK